MRESPTEPTEPTEPLASGGEWLTATLRAPGYRTELRAGAHAFVADEPVAAGGTDAGPTPYDLLLGAIAACTAMTLHMYADRKGWPLEEVAVRIRNSRSYAADCADCATKAVGFRRLERRIEMRGALDDEQRARLLAVADRCPVKQSLAAGITVESVTCRPVPRHPTGANPERPNGRRSRVDDARAARRRGEAAARRDSRAPGQ
jgi:putative redox protein